MNYKELDMVVLTRDLPKLSLRRGDVGTIVFAYTPSAFEVEFVRASGTTAAVVELTDGDVRPAGDDDQLAVRNTAAAETQRA